MKSVYEYEEVEKIMLQMMDAAVEIAMEFPAFRSGYQTRPAQVKAALHAAAVAMLKYDPKAERYPRRPDGQFTPQLLNVSINGGDNLVEMLVRIAHNCVEAEATTMGGDDVGKDTFGWRKCEPSSLQDLPTERPLWLAPNDTIECPSCGNNMDDYLGIASVPQSQDATTFPQVSCVGDVTVKPSGAAVINPEGQSPKIPDAFWSKIPPFLM